MRAQLQSRATSFLKCFYRFAQKKSSSTQVLNTQVNQISLSRENKLKLMPRSFSWLFILATIPTFYWIKQLLKRPYGDSNYVELINRFYRYIFSYNLLFFTCTIGLVQMNCLSPTTKTLVFRSKVSRVMFTSLPLLLSMIGLLIPENQSKYMGWLGLTSIWSATLIEAIYSNSAYLPYWYYELRFHNCLYFTLCLVIMYYVSKRLGNRRVTHPHEFISEIDSLIQ